MHLRPYISFKGECREAIELYSQAFGTKADNIMTFADAPQLNAPEECREWVLQATMPIGDDYIRLSDCTGLNDTVSERVALAAECTEQEVRRAFDVLFREGAVHMPLQQTFFSPCYGIVVDKSGVMWNLAALAK